MNKSQLIKQMKEALVLTERDLAKELGITFMSLYNYKVGKGSKILSNYIKSISYLIEKGEYNAYKKSE